MNWEAFFVIGLFTLVLGILIYLPAKIWINYKLRTEPGIHPKLKLTKTGWVLISIVLLVLFGGFSAQYTMPNSVIGQFVNTSIGRLLFLVIAVLLFWLIESILKALGIKLIKEVCP